jgi:hypothetical protein
MASSYSGSGKKEKSRHLTLMPDGGPTTLMPLTDPSVRPFPKNEHCVHASSLILKMQLPF